MKDLISIIIPTYNRANLIIETLESIIAQSYSSWECIIIDDLSTDNTTEVINNYIKFDSRFTLIQREKTQTKGPSSCRNIGIVNAKGNYILFLDSDDLISKNCLENRFNTAVANPYYDMYIFKTHLFYDKIQNLGEIFNSDFKTFSDKNYLDSFVKDNYPFCIMSVLWLTAKLKQLGGFDENLLVLEDPDLHINAFVNNLKSFTALEILPDNFYRKSLTNTYQSFEFKLKHVKSKYVFYKKYLPKFKTRMGKMPITFFRVEVLEIGNSLEVFKYYFLFIKNKIFTIKQTFLIPLLMIYKIFKLEKTKGLGFYKLSIYLLKND